MHLVTVIQQNLDITKLLEARNKFVILSHTHTEACGGCIKNMKLFCYTGVRYIAV